MIKNVHKYVESPNGLRCLHCKRFKKQIDNFTPRIAAKWNMICAEEQLKKVKKEVKKAKNVRKKKREFVQIELFSDYLTNQEG